MVDIKYLVHWFPDPEKAGLDGCEIYKRSYVQQRLQPVNYSKPMSAPPWEASVTISLTLQIVKAIKFKITKNTSLDGWGIPMHWGRDGWEMHF